MDRQVVAEVKEDFEKYNEDPDKTVEQWVEDMNALYRTYYNIYKDE